MKKTRHQKKSKAWDVVRWFVSVFLILLIFVTVIISIPLVSVSSTITSRDNIKDHLEQSGIYENIFGVIADFFPQQEGGEMIDFSGIINQMVTPEQAKKNIEGAVDGTYDWLEGKIDRPEFEIEIIPKDIDLVDTFSESINELPECEDDYSFTLQEGQSFELECRPKGLNLDQLNLYGFDVMDVAPSFEGVTIKSSDIPIDPTWAKRAQGIFFFLKYSSIFFSLYILILCGCLILVMPALERGRGFIICGITLFVPGIFLLFASIVLALLDFNSVFNIFGQAIPFDVVSVINSLISFFNLMYLEIIARVGSYSLVVLIFGIALFVIGMVMRVKFTRKEKEKRMKRKIKNAAYKPD